MEKDRRDFKDTFPHSTDFSDSSDFHSVPKNNGVTHRPRKASGGLAPVLLIIGLSVLAVFAMAHWLQN